MEHVVDPAEYILHRRLERLAGNAVAAVVALPLLARGLHGPLRAAFAASGGFVPPGLAGLWLPRHPLLAVGAGVGGGLLEDRHARLAWGDALATGTATEPVMWTGRTLAPCVALVLCPWLAVKALDGEMKVRGGASELTVMCLQ